NNPTQGKAHAMSQQSNRISPLLRPQILFALIASCLLLTIARSPARINVVTLPGRDSVQLTIYNSVDLTLVKETRLLTFRKVINLAGHVRVTNNSGEDYENARLRLVVGVIRLVEDIAELARRGEPQGVEGKRLDWGEKDQKLRRQAESELADKIELSVKLGEK